MSKYGSHRRRGWVETLENRLLLSVTLDPATKTLTINGTAGADTISLQTDGATVNGHDNGTPFSFPDAQVDLILINGLGGNDHISVPINDGADEISITGGDGDDTIVIGNGNTRLIKMAIGVFGGAGNDKLLIDDSAVIREAEYAIRDTTITRQLFGGIVYDNTLEDLTIEAGHSSMYAQVFSLSANTDLHFINVSTGAISVGGGRIDNVKGHVTVEGNSYSNSVGVDDSLSTADTAYTISNNQVFGGTSFGGLSFVKSDSLSLRGGNGNDSFDLNETEEATNQRIYGGGGNDVFHVGDGNLGVLPDAIIDGGSGVNTIEFNDAAGTNDVDYTFHRVTQFVPGGFRLSNGTIFQLAGFTSMHLIGAPGGDYGFQNTICPVTVELGSGEHDIGINTPDVVGAITFNGGSTESVTLGVSAEGTANATASPAGIFGFGSPIIFQNPAAMRALQINASGGDQRIIVTGVIKNLKVFTGFGNDYVDIRNSTLDTAVGGDGDDTISCTANDVVSEFEHFANSSISGNVFNDPNSNGVKNTGEAGIVGVKIYDDANNNGALDAGENSTTTDANGNYQLTKVVDGQRRVRMILPAGHRKTLPASGVPGYDLNVPTGKAGVSITNQNFGATTNIRLAGTVYNDANANGIQDAGENALDGVTVNVISNNQIIATRTTNEFGFWEVKGLSAGTGSVQVVLPTPFAPTWPAGGKYTGSMSAGQQNANLNFGLIEPVNFRPTPGPGILRGRMTSIGVDEVLEKMPQ